MNLNPTLARPRRTRLRPSHRLALALALSLGFLTPLPPRAATPTSTTAVRELLDKSVAAWRAGDTSQALTLSQKAVEKDPDNTTAWLMRARLFDQLQQHEAAATNLTAAVLLNPKNPGILMERGSAWFRAGAIASAVVDFDRFNELAPERAPHNWQRGIALYYAGRFADGRKQFEIHQTVNGNDVENAVWHFLCTVRDQGIAKARASLIPIEGDSRVPMAQVHQLFAGKTTPEAVLAAAGSDTSDPTRRSQVFYAHLYLGLYHEAIGDSSKSTHHIAEAARLAGRTDYMGAVARVHHQLRAGKPLPSPAP